MRRFRCSLSLSSFTPMGEGEEEVVFVGLGWLFFIVDILVLRFALVTLVFFFFFRTFKSLLIGQPNCENKSETY